jgi:hypothetical protein
VSNAISPNLETRSAIFWASLIFGLIAINLGIAAFALVVAIADPSFRPLPDYHSQAVDWQNHKDLLTQSDRLGWQIKIDPFEAPLGVRVFVTDAQGSPVTGGTGTLMAYHFTRSAEHRCVRLQESQQEAGVYYAQMPIDRDGNWQMSLDLRGPQGEQYIAERTVDWSIR